MCCIYDFIDLTKKEYNFIILWNISGLFGTSFNYHQLMSCTHTPLVPLGNRLVIHVSSHKYISHVKKNHMMRSLKGLHPCPVCSLHFVRNKHNEPINASICSSYLPILLHLKLCSGGQAGGCI